MQSENPDFPGFFIKRDTKEQTEEIDGEFDDFLGEFSEEEESEEEEEEGGESDVEEEVIGSGDENFDWEMPEVIDDEEECEKDLDGFAPAGVGYGNITEETLSWKKDKLSKRERKQKAREAMREKPTVTVCARCHSLRNYGQIKNQKLENLIPDFDFDRLISTRLMKTSNSGANTVVVLVVDCVDFDGSFPRKAAESLLKALQKGSKLQKLPKLVLVATKVDLLPSQISPTRLDRWVRHRAKAGGASKLSGVYLVSAKKDLGVRNLLMFIKEVAGPRGNVWVVGAQNAGKSTLINAFAKREGNKMTQLTEAAVPGTTLGIVRIGGILPAKAKMYDNPGLLHPYLMSLRLTRDEQKMVEIRKELQPRTYRMKVGQTIHVGGLMRLNLTHASVETIYVTVWASPNMSLHFGKIENAEELWKKHVGTRLQPPIGDERISELEEWGQQEFKVSGIRWVVNSMDIAIAGLGWFSLGLKGEATLRLWIYDAIDVTVREPMVLDRAPFLERFGFWLPKAISENERKEEAGLSEAKG
ncbi:GTP-binding protein BRASSINAZOLE INSENSITIVE PALE GREEN 2, chloroplastic isoform X1 [Amborella trichopoda]|uniref:Uncharacterized protein n=1 Tax=Amborella trichopoda TaxID=13333 RepID=W1PDA8_AMBTC|nr:GTP-binding protein BRASSINAZOLE INSENSITIVE PALE GREEN 2, chloroplastic isoform X1 [Amborella trichopoda]XP_020522752.1 GTP-binding protein BRASSINAZOLE INSENSITIVE PALE GREEN 2, chloroplastic isoform X1 [Amborella trichopoda]XP_020522753.1 GTP-binding protein BRASSINAZOLE INSENSITIVE PALE GREEN 2, chloroplastic isoform X1 [Amborella trichopoda]XP_020522754.1 GTP-binding protein BRASSINAZOLE INSENSITIVE PALE GREEN 2, chloroplastic isoform X1 [Amborella trichopoda]XP_020522755.1 GTP-binding |eukprot:XP_020522751.1 GTP-binding protein BRASSINAZOLE INSENSITIVE PALE GREEN 2, chloroplastic isoform X1 [Amborella trichopoda]